MTQNKANKQPSFVTHRDELYHQLLKCRNLTWELLFEGRKAGRWPPLCSTLSVLLQQGHLHPRCCQFPFPSPLTAASHCSLMSPHLLCPANPQVPSPSCPICGRGKAARNPGTKHCWIQHISKKNLTLGLTRPLLQSVVTLPVDFSATRSVFLLRSCNIPQCSQRRGQEKIGRFLSYGDGSNQSLYYQTDSSTRRTAVSAKISPQQKKRSFFSPKSWAWTPLREAKLQKFCYSPC